MNHAPSHGNGPLRPQQAARRTLPGSPAGTVPAQAARTAAPTAMRATRARSAARYPRQPWQRQTVRRPVRAGLQTRARPGLAPVVRLPVGDRPGRHRTVGGRRDGRAELPRRQRVAQLVSPRLLTSRRPRWPRGAPRPAGKSEHDLSATSAGVEPGGLARQVVALGEVGCLVGRLGVQPCRRRHVAVALVEVRRHRGVAGQ